MLVRNKIYSFTQSFIESFLVLFRSCQMYKFGVLPANFLCFVEIIQLTSKCKRRFSSSFCFLIGSLFCVIIIYFISSLDHFTTFEFSTFKNQ